MWKSAARIALRILCLYDVGTLSARSLSTRIRLTGHQRRPRSDQAMREGCRGQFDQLTVAGADEAQRPLAHDPCRAPDPLRIRHVPADTRAMV